MSLTTSEPAAPTCPDQVPEKLADAFRDLRELVCEWRSEGRKTTAAGLKPALQRVRPGFSESDLGFDAFRDFVIAAEVAGYVSLHRLRTGHTLLLPHGEQPTETDLTPSRVREVPVSPRTASSAVDQVERLKPDVWVSFIDWHESYVRLWDRQAHHAFMYPVDERGRALWESAPDRFVRVTPVEQEEQIEWMRDWARSLPEDLRSRVLDALAPNRPPGQFSRELTAAGLGPQWRANLQERVFRRVADWAAEKQVPVNELVDRRAKRSTADKAEQWSTKPDAARGGAGVSTRAAADNVRAERDPMNDRAGNDAARLRTLLHRAIDRMSLSELLEIPVRAEHLLDR